MSSSLKRVVENEAVALAVLVESPYRLVELRLDLGDELGVGLLDRRSQRLESGLGAVDVGLEVPEIGMRVALLLAGDLRRRDLGQQVDRALRDLAGIEVGLDRDVVEVGDVVS